MQTHPPRRYKKSADILEALRTRIIALRQDGATHLPGERDLALELDAGRPTIAKALRQLTQEGLLGRSKGGNKILPFKQRFRYAYTASIHKINGEFWYSAYQQLWNQVEKLAREKKIAMEFVGYNQNHDTDPASNMEDRRRLGEFDVVFISLLGGGYGPTLARELRERGVKVFIVDENAETADIPLFCLGNFSVGEVAARTLFEYGYRKTALIAPMINAASIDFLNRINGFTSTMRTLGGAFELFISNTKSQMDELVLMQKCIDKLPARGFDSAFFLCDAWISLADNLIQEGKTPEFGILAFDGTMKSRTHMPPIDTLTHGTVQVARQIISVAESLEAGSLKYDPNERLRIAPEIIKGTTLTRKR